MSLRALARDIAIYGSGDAILRATAFLTLPIYSRLFDPDEFGVWSFLTTFTFLLNTVLLLGADAAYARFFLATKDWRERQVLTSTLLVLVAAASSLAIALLLPLSALISDWSFGTEEHDVLVALALLTGPVLVVNALLGQALRNQFRPVPFALLNIVTAVLGVALGVYLVVGRDWGVKGVLAGALGGSLAVVPLRIWFVRDLLVRVFSFDVARRSLVFGAPLVPAALSGWILAMSDRIVLGKLSTFEEVGLYAVAASVASAITFLLTPLGQAWSPHAVEAYEADPNAARVFYGRVLTYILVGFGFLAVLVTVWADELLDLLTTPSFHGAERAIAPLALGAVAAATVQVTAAAISLRHKTLYVPLISWSGALLNVGLNLLLVPSYGMQASAWATAVSAVALTAAYGVVSHRLWPVAYESRRLVAVAVLVIAFTLGARWLPELPLAAALPLKTTYCVAFLAALFSFGGLDRREASAARTFLRTLAPDRS